MASSRFLLRGWQEAAEARYTHLTKLVDLYK